MAKEAVGGFIGEPASNSSSSSGSNPFEEFKKASPKEKMLILGGIGIVILVVLYIYSKSQSSSSNTAATDTGGSAGGIQTVPGPNGSQIPIIPTGLCANYDPQGNLINYAPCGGTTTGTRGPAGPAGPAGPTGKPGTVGKPSLPVSPVLVPKPIVRQATTTASVAARRSPTAPARVAIGVTGHPLINIPQNAPPPSQPVPAQPVTSAKTVKPLHGPF